MLSPAGPTGTLVTIAGSASFVSGATGDGGPATSALLTMPSGIAGDGVGCLAFSDQAS